MARFDLSQYQMVETRIAEFYRDFPDGRIVTYIVDDPEQWIFTAKIYLDCGEQGNDWPKATGWATEPKQGPRAEFGAENCETSAIGRALANMGRHGNKRASLEEMRKVIPADYLAEADKTTDVKALRLLWAHAKQNGASKDVLEKLEEKARVLGNSGGGDS